MIMFNLARSVPHIYLYKSVGNTLLRFWMQFLFKLQNLYFQYNISDNRIQFIIQSLK